MIKMASKLLNPGFGTWLRLNRTSTSSPSARLSPPSSQRPPLSCPNRSLHLVPNSCRDKLQSSCCVSSPVSLVFKTGKLKGSARDGAHLDGALLPLWARLNGIRAPYNRSFGYLRVLINTGRHGKQWTVDSNLFATPSGLHLLPLLKKGWLKTRLCNLACSFKWK